jgi:hypothetical protein
MIRDPFERLEDLCLMRAEDPIQTTLPVELRGIRFPSTIEGAKLTTRLEWGESGAAKRCL